MLNKTFKEKGHQVSIDFVSRGTYINLGYNSIRAVLDVWTRGTQQFKALQPVATAPPLIHKHIKTMELQVWNYFGILQWSTLCYRSLQFKRAVDLFKSCCRCQSQQVGSMIG